MLLDEFGQGAGHEVLFGGFAAVVVGDQHGESCMNVLFVISFNILLQVRELVHRISAKEEGWSLDVTLKPKGRT